jgi:two-component system, NtrC family, response regulator HydG
VAPERPLALAGNDPALLRAIQHHLHKAIGQNAFICSLDAVTDLLGPETDGLLVLVAAAPADTNTIHALVREIHLHKLSARLMLLETEESAEGRALADLDAYTSGRLSWPDHGRGLVSWVRRHLSQAGSFRSEASANLRDAIARRLARHTPSLAPLADSLVLAAAHPVTVLMDGETGTGKTYLARLIHDCSPRKPHRFVVVPCGALAANLVENEFFGHVKGAFTGADAAKVGKFAAAGHGTLLLDEIDALPLEQQANLLRVIETGEFEPVGSNDTQLCTARIIAATNWNLEEAVAQGQFRRDLFYRLNVLPFYLPPLRERIEDIAPLARGLVARFADKFGKDLFAIAPEVVATLEALPWPGNIRQLENVLQQAVLVSTGPELRLEDLPAAVTSPAPRSGPTHNLACHREAHERVAIVRALENAGSSRTRAAQALGVSRVTLYKKMKKYGLMNQSAALPAAEGPQPTTRAAIA